MAKQKICFLIPGFNEGGAQKQCIYLINELQNNSDLEIHLIYFFRGVNFDLLNHENIFGWQIDVTSFYNPINIVKIFSRLNQIKPHVLFSWLHSCDIYAFVIRFLMKDLKWVLAERNSWYAFDPRFLLRKYAGLKADMIICNSAKGKLYWKKAKVSDSKVHVVPNILNVSHGKPISDFQGSPVVLYAGRFAPQKNIVNVVKGFCKAAGKYTNGKFIIIGSGELQNALQSLIDEDDVKDRVFILPFQKEIIDYYLTADVFVNISYHEGMPNTVIENAALDKKMVVSYIPEHVDILGEDYPFYVRNIDNIEEIVNVIDFAISYDKSYSIPSSVKQRLSHMDSKRVTNEYIRLFNQVIGS